jgi:glycosyltransferase involved in cell wall biosynthesis
MSSKKKILILSDWFDPAYKAGGPIRSAVNLVNQMKHEFDFFILTTDRDLNDTKAMEGIISNKWIDYSPGVRICYCSSANLHLKNLKEHIDSINPYAIYLNSMFSKKFTIYPLWLKRTNRISSKVVVAPRGMLKSTALDFKRRKKKIFLSLFKWMRIQQYVSFHATDEQEKSDVIKQIGSDVNVSIIPNFPSSQGELSLPADKQKGSLKILFVGRIHPIKGLDVLLNALKSVKLNIRLTIVGNPEDISYRNSCRKIADSLPGNIQVAFVNVQPHRNINQLIRDNHLFCLPTKGENFGHAIFEALSIGRPVLISDQTPWRNLSIHKAGWDISLNNQKKFAEIIEHCALTDSDEFNEWCVGAWQFCKKYIESLSLKQDYLKLFS